MPTEDKPARGQWRRFARSQVSVPTLPTFDLGRQARCPTCLIEIDPEAMRTVTYDGRTGYGKMRVRGPFGGKRQREVSVAELQELKRFTCPRGHTLPDDFFTLGLLPIALLGLSQSMKTHYVAALAKQMVRDYRLAVLPRGASLTFQTIDACQERVAHEYVEPLFDHRRVLIPTIAVLDPRAVEPVRDPITFEAEYRPAPGMFSRPTSRYISLFDAPGEKLKFRQDQVVHAPYLFEPGGVMLFADVGGIPEVRDVLGGGAPDRYSSLDPQIVVNAARSMRDRTGGRKLNVPVSVIVSRADLLVGHPAFDSIQDGLGGEPLLADDANEIARRFVWDHAPGVGIEAQKWFGDRVRYFFASATGTAPAADDTFPFVSPWGCLGPLLHILTEHGFVKR